MKLTNRQIVQAVTALKAIPALKKTAKGAYGLAKNLAALQDALKPIEDTNRALFKESFADQQQVDAKHPKFVEYQEAVRKLDETETDVPLHLIEQADLNLAENEIHHDHLAAIRFIIKDW